MCLAVFVSDSRFMDTDMIPHISRLPAVRIKDILSPIKGVVFDVDGTLTIPGMHATNSA